MARNTPLTPEEWLANFWSKRIIVMRRPDLNLGPCWEFVGTNTRGCGYIRRGDKTLRVPRVAYELAIGPIPDDKCVLHHCDNPPCYNPDHLWCDTQLANVRDCIKKGRKAPCHGENNGNSKIKESDIPVILRMHLAGQLTRDIGMYFNVNEATISDVINNKTWKHVNRYG